MSQFSDIFRIIGAIMTLLGSIFLFMGALGVFRMPDIYAKMQAGTKATTLGNILTLTGLGLLMPGWLPKIFMLITFVLITNPLSSHALARAAHRQGMPLADGYVLDSLRDDEEKARIKPGDTTELNAEGTVQL